MIGRGGSGERTRAKKGRRVGKWQWDAQVPSTETSLRAHREDHPLQQSRVARSKRGRGERIGRQNRHLLLLVPTAWLEQKSGTGVWILDFCFTECLAEQMESYGENGRETEKRSRAGDSERLYLFILFTWHRADSSIISVPFLSCMSSNIFFFPAPLSHVEYHSRDSSVSILQCHHG